MSVGSYHLAPRFIMQKDACFYATKRMLDFVDDTVDQLIQVKYGCDFLRRLLDVLQPVD